QPHQLAHFILRGSSGDASYTRRGEVTYYFALQWGSHWTKSPLARVNLSLPVANAIMASGVISRPLLPPSSVTSLPSHMTNTRSAIPTISGSSLEIITTQTPDAANALMILYISDLAP